MNSILVCVSLVVLAQGWDKPVIQESELAAPTVMQQDAQPADAGASPRSWDIDSSDPGNVPQAKAADEPEKEVTTRWEYDEEGRPVARTEERPVQTNKATAVALEEQPADRTETTQEKRSSGRIATFWFLLPRR